MYRQPWCSFSLAGVSLTDYGLKIPSPFSSLTLTNSQITSMTSWELTIQVGGDSDNKINIAAFEALIYQSAQQSDVSTSAGVPVTFSFGWLDAEGRVEDYTSYQGFTLKYSASTTGLYMTYTVEGYASLALQASEPVIRIPELRGVVQPSAVVEALYRAVKADTYYQLDIDHNDSPTLIDHGALNTSFNTYIRGTYDGTDDYDSFPGLLRLSKSYSGSRAAAGLKYPYRKLSTLRSVKGTNLSPYLKGSLTDSTPQTLNFSYWVTEPTMTSQGVIHYKSNANLTKNFSSDVLRYGTKDSNVLTMSVNYNGIAYNMTDMNFRTVGFAVDTSGDTVINDEEVVNSWSASLPDVYQSANIINDVNAIASQFSGDATLTIPGTTTAYSVAQPISLLVMSQNTVSPVTGIYNIVSVSHTISDTFVTTLKVQRLQISDANAVASGQGIYEKSSSEYRSAFSNYSTTSNIRSPYKVDFGNIYPTFEHMQQLMA